MKCINIEIIKEVLCLSLKKVEFYFFISLEKKYIIRISVVEIYFLEKKNKSYCDLYLFLIKIKMSEGR